MKSRFLFWIPGGAALASAKKVTFADGRSVFGESPSDANSTGYNQQ
jgi:hypothetical protein